MSVDGLLLFIALFCGATALHIIRLRWTNRHIYRELRAVKRGELDVENAKYVERRSGLVINPETDLPMASPSYRIRSDALDI